MSRIVNTDNYGGDYPDESFILWPMSKVSAEKITTILNQDAGPEASRYFKVVDMDYKLQPGFEP